VAFFISCSKYPARQPFSAIQHLTCSKTSSGR